MQPLRATRFWSFIGLALLASAGSGAALPAGKDEPPTGRSFMRIGTSKLRHGSQIMALAYSPDGQILVAGGGIDPLRFWDPKTGAVIRAFNEPWVQAITFTSSGETVLFASLQKKIRLWNFKLNKEFVLEGHKAAIKALAVSPNTSIIASGSQDGAIYLWDWGTKRKFEELKGHADEVTALVFSPDNTLLISAGSDRTIQFWNTDTNKSKLKIDAGCGVQALAISTDGKVLFSAGDDNLIRRWDVETGKQTGIFKGHEGSIVSLILQGNTLVSGALDRTIRFWDAQTTKQLRSLPRRQGDDNALALTKAGDLLATAGTNNTIRILDTASGKEVLPTADPQAGLATMTASPDRKQLAAVTLEGRILLVDAQAGKIVRGWDSKQTGDILLAWTPDGKALVSAAESARFWNPQTGAEIHQLPARDLILTLAFSPDGKRLALGQRNAQIDVWDIDQKKYVQSFKYAGSLHAVAWSPNGKWLAAGGLGKIMLWDAQNGSVFKAFDVKEGPPPVFPQVASLVFGPDSRTLAAGCFDAMIRVYNLQAQNPTAEKSQRICEGHLSMPYSVAFSGDGRTLVSGSFDNTVRLWEAFSGRQIVQFKGHVGAVMGVAFAADGRSVYSAGSDANFFQWDVPGLLNNGKLPDLTLTYQELEKAWQDLTSEDTPRGHETMWRCIAFGKQAVPYMAKKLYLLDPERVNKLFRDLDSNHFGTRLAAMKELEDKKRWMEGRFDAAIANPPSLEYKRRVESLKEKLNAINSPTLVQERLRVHRFMLMCEQVGNTDALEALRKLASQGPEEELREEAKGSLQRLEKQR